MSYILNALRKSEQERQAKQQETITGQVLVSPAESKPRTKGFIAVLAVCNLLALAGVAWYLKIDNDQAANERAPPQAQAVKAKTVARPENKQTPANINIPGQGEAPVLQQHRAANAPVPPRPVITPSSPSLEDLAKAQYSTGTRLQPESATANVRRRSALVELRKGLPAKNAPVRTGPSLAAKSPETEGRKPAMPPSTRVPEGVAEKEGAIPLFKDLPYDFKNNTPKLSINVFKYDQRPDERFVVLNMAKYKAGQTTKEFFEIKEIREDGVIVSYAGRTFRIERP